MRLAFVARPHARPLVAVQRFAGADDAATAAVEAATAAAGTTAKADPRGHCSQHSSSQEQMMQEQQQSERLQQQGPDPHDGLTWDGEFELSCLRQGWEARCRGH